MSPMPKRYTKVHKITLSDEVDQLLKEKAEIMGLKPAVLVRSLIEHSVGGGVLTPLIEDKNAEQ